MVNLEPRGAPLPPFGLKKHPLLFIELKLTNVLFLMVILYA